MRGGGSACVEGVVRAWRGSAWKGKTRGGGEGVKEKRDERER